MPELTQDHPPRQKLYSLGIWIVLGAYLVCFIFFAWQDLYDKQITKGLYATHYSPYESNLGYVIDPKPETKLAQELMRRLSFDSPPNVSSWNAALESLVNQVAERSLRAPKSDEVLVAQAHDGHLFLVLNRYQGQWVTFRPNIGVVLELPALDKIANRGFILRVSPQ